MVNFVKNNSITDTDAKLLSSEIVKQDTFAENNFYKKKSPCVSVGFKSVLTAVLTVMVSVFSFLFFGFIILMVFALLALIFLLLRFPGKRK